MIIRLIPTFLLPLQQMRDLSMHLNDINTVSALPSHIDNTEITINHQLINAMGGCLHGQKYRPEDIYQFDTPGGLVP
jgi:hypothetical protein